MANIVFLLAIAAQVAVLALVVVVVVLVVRGLARTPTQLPPTPPPPPLAISAARRTLAWRWAGVLAGTVAAVLTAQLDVLGRGLLLAAPVFGLVLLTGVLAGELTVRPLSSGHRSASLRPRQVTDYLPRRLATVVASSAVALLALLVATTVVGRPDDLGRAGRAITTWCGDAVSSTGSPWPGSFYSLPLGAIVLVGLAAAWLVLQRVTQRPSLGTTSELGRLDDAMRRRSAEAVTAAVGVLVAAPFVGVASTAGFQLLEHDPCAPEWWAVSGAALLLLLPLLSAMLIWCAAVLLRPTPAVAPTTAQQP